MGTDFPFFKMKRVLEMDGSDGYKTIEMYLMSLNGSPKMINMMHFKLWVFYRNKK